MADSHRKQPGDERSRGNLVNTSLSAHRSPEWCVGCVGYARYSYGSMSPKVIFRKGMIKQGGNTVNFVLGVFPRAFIFSIER